MTGVWPWLAVAGAGALHGLNPASGWAFMATRARAWRALALVAIGHAASVVAIVAMAALGLLAQRGVLPWLAGGLAVVVAAVHVAGHLPQSLNALAGQSSVALWSFTMGVAHGTGLMLVPALIPLCLSGSPAREITASGSLTLAVTAVGVHLAALLGVAGAMASLARLGWGWRWEGRGVWQLPVRAGAAATAVPLTAQGEVPDADPVPTWFPRDRRQAPPSIADGDICCVRRGGANDGVARHLGQLPAMR